jgi:uncharacterized protein (DUF1778 family)
MAISTSEQPKDWRFHLRANVREKTLIKVAATRQGMNVIDFILNAARDRADETLTDRTRSVLHEGQWKQFMRTLDRPAREKPRLRKLFKESHAAESGS